MMDFAMAVFCNYAFLSLGSSLGKLSNHILSTVTLTLYVLLIYKLISIMVRLELSRRDKVEKTHLKTKFKRWLFLRIPVRQEARTIPRFTPEIYLLHDLLLCFFLTVFHGNARVQIYSLIALKLFVLVNLLYLPFKEWLD